MNLQEARKRIPELDGLSDDAALSVIQQVYYPDIDRSTLASRLGVKVAAPPAPERTWGQAIGDTAVQLAEGVNTTLGAIPSIVAPEGSMAGFFRDNADYWRDKQSDVLKKRIAATDQRIQEAGKEGVMSQIGTAVSEYWDDPAQAARLVATNLPSMAATLGTGALAGAAAKGVAAARGVGAAGEAALAAQYGTRTAMATNAALNAGGARGEAYEDLKRAALAQGMSSEQAEQAALDGSVMPGVVGGVAGAVSGKLGLEKALLGQPGAGAGTALRRAAGSFGAELAGEQIEEVAPKLTTNYEAGKIDPARSLTDDLGRTMVETAIGAGPGAIVAGGVEGMSTPAQDAADTIRAAEDAPESAPTLALPAPERGVIQVGGDGTARTPSYQTPSYVGDVTDVEPRAVNPVREQVAAAAEQGGTLSRAALKAIDTGLSDAMQPAPEQAPPQISLEEADARDQAAYEQFFTGLDADPVVGRYFENDDDIPDFDAASNASEEDFLRALGATDEDIQDAIATASQPAIPQSRLANDVGPQANEPAGPRQGAGGNQEAPGQVTPRQPDNFTGTPTATLSQQGVTARPGPEFGPQYALAQVRPNQKREAAAEGMATPAPTDILNPAGLPFKTRMAADRAAKKTPGAVVPVEGGFVVRPQEPVNVQDVPQAPEVSQAAPVVSPPGQAPQAVGTQPAGPTAGVPAEGSGAVEAAGVAPAGNAGNAGNATGVAGAPTIVEVQDNYGRTHRVRQSDLYSNADRIPTVRQNGEVVAGEEIPRSIVKDAPTVAEPPPLDPLGWNPKKLASTYDMAQMQDLYQYVLRNYSNPVVVGGPVENGKATTERLNAEGRKIHAALQQAQTTLYKQSEAKREAAKNLLPPTDIRTGDKVVVDGERYTVTGPLKEGRQAVGVVASRDADTDPMAGVQQVFLRGDDAVRAKLAADAESSDSSTTQAQPQPVPAVKLTGIDKEYARLTQLRTAKVMLKQPDGRTLYDVTLSPQWRNKHMTGSFPTQRFQNTDNFEIKRKSDVTGNPGDKGFVLIDKRAQNAQRAARNPTVAPASQAQQSIAPAPSVGAPLDALQNQAGAPTQQAQAATENVAAPAQETTYNGTRIYPTKVKVGDEVKSMWAAESPDNQRRRAAGERTIGGDSLHDTLEQAQAAAEREAKRDAEQQEAKAEQDAADKARLDAEEARKAANRPKTVVERRKDAILDGPSKIGQGTKRAVITTAVDNGYAIEAKMVYDYAAKKRDQEAVDRASRAGYILGVSNENLPLVKAGNEAKARLKEGKYEKPEYRVYQGSDTKAPFREITKTEYDYAQELKAQRADAQQAQAATEPVAQPITSADAEAAQQQAAEAEAKREKAVEPVPKVSEAELLADIQQSITERQAEFDAMTAKPGFDENKALRLAQHLANMQLVVKLMTEGKTYQDAIAEVYGDSLKKFTIEDIGKALAGNQRLSDGTTLADIKPAEYGNPLTDYVKQKIDEARADKRSATAPAAQPEAPKLTPAEAKSLMAWEDLGQKDGVKTHALTFYESQADKDAKRGRMIVAKVSKGDRSATAWMVDGEDKTFGALAQAKKLAEEVGMAKAVADGFVESPFAKYEAEARAYGYEITADGRLSKNGKVLSPVLNESGGRLRIESPDGNLLFSGKQSGEALGQFVSKFWGAEKKADGFVEPAAAPASPQEDIAQAQANAARFEIGKSLTKEQRKQVLDSLVDVYKSKGAEREFKGQDGNGNDRYGYAHSPDLFERSGITGAMVRYYVTLPDGRIAHPTELFPDVSASDIERMVLEQEANSKSEKAFENAIKPFYKDFDSANLMAVAGQVVISKGDRFAIIPDRIGSVNQARQQGWELAKAAAPAANPAASNDRNAFTLQRLNRDTDQMEPVTFERGEYVRYTVGGKDQFGDIDGISQARKEFSVDGLWYPFGFAYKAERPAAPKADTVPLSSVIDKVNAKNGQGLTDADRVPGATDIGWDAMSHEQRTQILTAPSGWSTAKGGLNVIGKNIAKRAWADIAPATRATIERLAQKLETTDAEPASKTPTVDRHNATMAAVREGKATPEQFQSSFEQVVSNKDAIVSELDTMTKVQLLREGGPLVQMRYANEKKAEVVDAVYRQIVGEYALGESVTYSMGKGAYEAAVRKMVEATDADKLARYVTDRKAAVEEMQSRRAAKAAAIENPQTLADFREVLNAKIREGMTRKEAFLTLAPQQRIQYDTLEAESTREARENRKRAQKTEVRTAGQTTAGEIVATKHTRDGYDLFVVKLADRLSKEDYSTVLASAKKLGGWYSAFRGNGAIPGFQFKDKANAEAFLALAGGDTTAAQEQVAQRRDAFEDDRSQTAVERLRAMADKLEEGAAEVEGQQRKTNTARRARFASAAMASAAADKAKAQTMRNIARAIEDGEAKFLDAVRTKSQVDMLTGIVDTAKGNELRAKYPSYADQEKRKGEPPTAETADFAEFPSYSAFRSDLATLGRQMLEVDGTKKLGQRLMSVADDVTDAYLEFAKANIQQVSQFGRGDALAEFASKDEAERAIKRSGLTGKAIVLPIKRGQNRVILSPSEAIGRGLWHGDGDKRITLTAEFGAELVEAIGRRGNKQNQLSVPWQFQNAYDRRKALSRIGIETPSEFRAALREFIGLKEQAVANRTRAMELQMVGRKADGLDFFPTSAEVADQMIEAADLSPDMAVLEPSAGMGHLADRIREAGAEPDVIEISADRRELLEEKGYTTQAVDDFLDLKPREFYTFGDTFRAPDGAEGIMRGANGNRVKLVNQAGDMVGTGYYDRADLTGIAHNGTASGYDRIIMNPPFSNRRDAEHVRHAYSLLKPGGRIVAIMGEGVFFGQDKKAQDFREWLESVGGTSEKLPEGSFMDPSLPVNTSVNARMVVIDKPATEGGNVAMFRSIRTAKSAQTKLSQDAVEKAVASALNRVVGAPKVQVVAAPADAGIDVPPGVIPKGVTLPDGSVLIFSDSAESVLDVFQTVFHELYHRGSKVRFTSNPDYITKMLEIASKDELVQQEVNAWKNTADGKDKWAEFQERGPMTGERLANFEALAVEEALATMAEKVAMGEVRKPETVIKQMARFIAKVANAWGMNRFALWLNTRSLAESEKFIIETIGMSGGKANEFTNSVLFRFKAEDISARVGDTLKSITVANVKQRAGFKLTDYLGIGLQTLGRRQIVDIYGDLLPLAEYNRLVQQMEADKNEGGAEADQLVTRWAKLDDEGKLADLMHDATLAQIDPAEDFVEGDDKGKYLELQRKFNLLSDGAKKVYADTRDSYKAHHAKVRSAIKERIERSEIKGERKAALLKQMDDEFFKAIKGVYFPLARFGQYAVTVKGPDGKVESVSRAETKAEAEALRNNLLTAFPRDKGFTVGRVMLSKDFIADRDAVGRGFMTELYQVLDKQDMDAAQRAELEDTLGQLYLSSLPDLSWAKHGIHRKGTPGFSQDARRAFAQNMFHGARYLAKLRYSDLMQDELTAMQRHVDDRREVDDFDQNSAQRVVDEMNKRHESLMNPKSNPLSTALTSLGFVFHLGLSPASAMVNLSQTALVAYPIMGAKWGFAKASAALLKASAEAAKGKNDITASLNADERAAYDEAVRAGTIDVTMAHDLAGIAQGEDAGVMWKIRPVMRWASFLFHHAERFNRQVTFVAAYRLAREAGADHKAAFEQATKATYDGHFDYSACVDDATEILTATGWKKRVDLKVGDVAIATDASGRAVHSQVLAVNVYEGDREVIEFKSSNRFSMVLTPNHDAVIQSYNSRDKKWQGVRKVRADSLKNHHFILRTPLAPLDKQGGIYGEDFASLLGWIAAEGWYSKYRKTKAATDVRIGQSVTHNPEYVAEIRGILERLGGEFKEYTYQRSRDVLTTFVLRRSLGRRIQECLPEKVLTPELVSAMSTSEMRAFVMAFLKGDGKRYEDGKAWAVGQKDGLNLDLLQAMATMCGMRSTLSPVNGSGIGMLYIVPDDTGARSHVRPLEQIRRTEPLVWCPTTEHGTWIARRNGAVFVTGNSNRPRIMQGNVAKVLLLFKQYGQNMVYTLARNAQQAIKGESPEVRAQARKALGGLLATHAAAAGVLGLPMVTTLLAAASMIGGDDDEPWDAKVALQNMLAGTLGQKPAEVLAHGLSRLTPWDISGRVGLDKLIFPDVQEGLEGQRLGEAAMAAALGPVAGIGINVLKGLQDMSQGQYARGLEAMMPAALRGPIKAIRYESEGVQDKTGVVIKDDVSLAGVAGQFLGFSPSEVRNATEGKSAIYQQDRALGERRQELLTKAARATMAKDAEARAEAMKEIERFNQKNPKLRITPLNVLQSVRNRQKRIDQAEGGVYLPKNRRDAMEAGRFAVVE